MNKSISEFCDIPILSANSLMLLFFSVGSLKVKVSFSSTLSPPQIKFHVSLSYYAFEIKRSDHQINSPRYIQGATNYISF